MAYEPKPIRILSGGLNLLLPGDVIDDAEAQECTNLSVDSYGALRSRRGHTLLFSVGGKVTAMTRALGAVASAAGGSVYLNGAAKIAGVTAGQVGIVGFKAFLWAMSPGDQRKTDGSNDWKWIPEAPTDPPTTKVAALVENTVADFSSGWTVDPSGDDSIVSGGLQIQAQTETVYSATAAFAIDLETGYSLDDLFKITMWCKEWSKIRGVTFQLDFNDNSFTKDYVTAEVLQADVKGGHKEEITIYIRKRPLPVDQGANDKFRYTHFERIGSTPEKGYKTVVGGRVKVDFKDTTKFRFSAWLIVGNSGATIEGDDEVIYFTYQTDAGHESNPSPASTPPLLVTRGAIKVDNLTDSPDPQVTSKNIYRTGDTLQDVLLVKRNTTNATSYTTSESNDDLTALGISLENDHDQPPQVAGLAGPFFDRLIAFGGGKLYWSHRNKPYAFAGPTLDDGDWAGVPESVGDLLAATVRPGVMFLYGTAGVAVLQGDPGGAASLFATAQSSGIQSSRAVVQSPRGDFANFSEGIYLAVSGVAGENLAKKILPVFKSSWQPSEAALGFRNDTVWFSDGAQTYVLDLSTGRIFKDSRVFSCFLSDGQGLLGADDSGNVYKLENTFTDNGAAINIAYTSKSYDAGLHDDEKRWGDFVIWANTGGATLSVSAILSQPDQTIALGTITSASETRFVLPFAASGEGVDARRCAIRITGACSAECVIHAMELWYYPKAREGKSFDTGELNFNDNRMKVLREIRFDLDNPASVGVTIKSDRPEPMANRSTAFTIANTSDRRIEPVVMTDEIIGRLFRIVLHGSDFRSYGGDALIQVFGTYLEGAKGEYYDSNPLDFGTEQVKLIYEAEMIYKGSGGQFKVSTDLPGNAIVERGVAPFNAVTTEQSVKFDFPDGIKGRLIEIRVEPTGDCRIEVIRLRLKIIGRPNATPWTWVELPLLGTQDGIWQPFGFQPDAPG